MIPHTTTDKPPSHCVRAKPLLLKLYITLKDKQNDLHRKLVTEGLLFESHSLPWKASTAYNRYKVALKYWSENGDVKERKIFTALKQSLKLKVIGDNLLAYIKHGALVSSSLADMIVADSGTYANAGSDDWKVSLERWLTNGPHEDSVFTFSSSVEFTQSEVEFIEKSCASCAWLDEPEIVVEGGSLTIVG